MFLEERRLRSITELRTFGISYTGNLRKTLSSAGCPVACSFPNSLDIVPTLRSHQSADSSLSPLAAVESARVGRPQLDATFSHSKSTLDLTLTLPETLEAPSILQQIEVGHNARDGDLTAYPSNLSVSIIVLGLCLASFTVALDNTIIGKL